MPSGIRAVFYYCQKPGILTSTLEMEKLNKPLQNKYVNGLKILIIGLIVFYGCLYFNGQPLSQETVKDLFGKDINCTFLKSKDFIGLDIHGDRFLYYEYAVSDAEMSHLTGLQTFKNYPEFKAGYFKNVKLPDSQYVFRWQHFPVKGMIDSLILQSTFSTFTVENEIGDKPYLGQDNYYSCISAKPVGNCFFIYVPKKGKLYMVVR